MRPILFILTFFLCVSAWAQTNIVKVNFADFGLVILANRQVTMTPVQTNQSAPWLISREPKKAKTDTNGTCYFTNIVAGTYDLDLASTPPTRFRIGVTNSGTNIQVAASGVGVAVDGNSVVAYTKTQSDARFAAKTNALFYGGEPKLNGTNFSTIFSGTTYTNNATSAGLITGSGIGTNISGITTNQMSAAAHALYEGRVNMIPANEGVMPFPRKYSMSSFGTNSLNEQIVTNYLMMMASNDYPKYGLDTYQLDAGWGIRGTNGNLDFNTNTFPKGGKWLVDLAHSLGIKINVYIQMGNTADMFDQPSSILYAERDAAYLSTNYNIDGFKLDCWAEESQRGLAARVFYNTVTALGRNIYLQASAGPTLMTDPLVGGSVELYSGVNSFYPAYGADDPNGRYTNTLQHFFSALKVIQHVRPGHYLEGLGWISNPETYLIPRTSGEHLQMVLSAMTCEHMMVALPNDTYGQPWVKNKTLNAIYQDPLVHPGSVVASNNNVMVMVRRLANDDSALMVLNMNTYPTNVVVPATLLGSWFGLPQKHPAGSSYQIADTNIIVTATCPFAEAIESWGTNSVSVSVLATNASLLRVARGYNAPAFSPGTNYLSDFNWKGSVNVEHYMGNGNFAFNVLNKDSRYSVGPLILGGTTYPKGFSTGVGFGVWTTNTFFEYPLGKKAAQFSARFGKQDAWDGAGGGARITIYLDGTQSFQSGYITNNSSQATNILIDVTGVQTIGFKVEHTATSQSVIANASVYVNGPGVPYVGSGAGVDYASVSGLTNALATKQDILPRIYDLPIPSPESIGGAAPTYGWGESVFGASGYQGYRFLTSGGSSFDSTYYHFWQIPKRITTGATNVSLIYYVHSTNQAVVAFRQIWSAYSNQTQVVNTFTDYLITNAANTVTAYTNSYSRTTPFADTETFTRVGLWLNAGRTNNAPYIVMDMRVEAR